MVTKIIALVVFFIPFILLTSFYPDFYSYQFYTGIQNSSIEKWIADAVALLFSGAIGLIAFKALEAFKPFWERFIQILQDLYEKNKNKEKIP